MSRVVMVPIAILVSVSAICAAQAQNVAAAGSTNYRNRFEAQSRSVFPLDDSGARAREVDSRTSAAGHGERRNRL